MCQILQLHRFLNHTKPNQPKTKTTAIEMSLPFGGPQPMHGHRGVRTEPHCYRSIYYYYTHQLIGKLVQCYIYKINQNINKNSIPLPTTSYTSLPSKDFSNCARISRSFSRDFPFCTWGTSLSQVSWCCPCTEPITIHIRAFFSQKKRM